MHGTAGGYEGAVSWLCNRDSEASAHLVLREDGGEATQLVPLHLKAWHARAYNARSLGVELAWTKGRWPLGQLRVVARVVAWLLHEYNLPPRWARFGIGKGIVRHRDLGQLGGGHYRCPTMTLARWLWLLALVRWELRRGHFRSEWALR